jgi:hypothetical protein
MTVARLRSRSFVNDHSSPLEYYILAVGSYRLFRLDQEEKRLFFDYFDLEDRGSKLLQNICNYLQTDTF